MEGVHQYERRGARKNPLEEHCRGCGTQSLESHGTLGISHTCIAVRMNHHREASAVRAP